jgi:esterase/lipase superfamily enzyme
VTIPRSHQLGKVESRNLIKLQFRDDPEKHSTLAGLDPLPQELFEAQLSRAGDAENAGVLIYVHGYNYDFRGAALRCAQIYWDIGLSVIPLLYSWHSQGTTAGYLKDQAAAAWTGSHLKDLIAVCLKQLRCGIFIFLRRA